MLPSNPIITSLFQVRVSGLKPSTPQSPMSPVGSPTVETPTTVLASEPQQFLVDASEAGDAPLKCAITVCPVNTKRQLGLAYHTPSRNYNSALGIITVRGVDVR